jgi:hypothetical protein
MYSPIRINIYVYLLSKSMFFLVENNRNVTRFLWLSNSNDPNSPLITYRFRVVLFGTTCSPFILNATVLKHLKLNQSHTSNLLKNDIGYSLEIGRFASCRNFM